MKPLVVVQAPFSTSSGYGVHSRMIIEALFKLDKYEVLLVPTNWGGTPMDALDEKNPVHAKMFHSILSGQLQRPIDVFIHITIPNEFQRHGKYNIGITAGMETTAVSAEWINGCNQMDLVLVPSKHSRDVFLNTSYQKTDNQSGQVIGELKCTKPIEVLFEGIDTTIFRKIDESELDASIMEMMKDVEEDHCYLFVGHWLQGDLGHDRKDVGMLIKVFLETFADMETRPALVLKSSSATFSIMDRKRTLEKIDIIKQSVQNTLSKDARLPNVYLLHGDLTQYEMNALYNHPKIKSFVSFTKGEGWGLPLLEFATTGKPIIVSGWSGHMDFINPVKHTLLQGEVKQVHKSATWENIIIKESGWFYVDYENASRVLLESFTKYKKYKYKAIDSEKEIRNKWSHDEMTVKLGELLEQYVGTPSQEVQLQLPKLQRKKVE